ncbi:MAG: YgeY family selenium metabolism-linked hydrolase [Armatimonadetes bacterium]|nr:YgeY family selenium metabolism-linked hydrolase [Armatimonadota bacterium]
MIAVQERLKKIKKIAETHKEDVVSFLRDLIRLPSPSCQEEKTAKRIHDEMKKVSFDRTTLDELGSVIGEIGKGKTRVLFDSHIDTVGIGDRNAWPHDPYEGAYDGEIVYGRGASDNKAAIACMVYAGKVLKDLEEETGCTFQVIGTVMEEDCDGLAMEHYLKKAEPKPDYVVLGECTNLSIYRGHRGRMEIKVTTKGVSCHASAPKRGDNAIYKMVPIISGIEALNGQLAYDSFLGRGTVAVTKIECQTPSLNAVPDECVIYLDRRLTTGEDRETAIQEIKELPGANGSEVEILPYSERTYKGTQVESEKYFPTWVLPEDHILVQRAVQCAKDLFGEDPVVDKWVFSTNGIASMGRLSIPTIGYGPSEERFAHTVSDQVSVEHLVRSVMFYAALPFYLGK